jgi:hypothetical protein
MATAAAAAAAALIAMNKAAAAKIALDSEMALKARVMDSANKNFVCSKGK